jgi:hypothetical protein
MKKYHINYAAVGSNCNENNPNPGYFNAQILNSETALSVAGFDQTVKYNLDKLPAEFKEKHKDYFNFKRGAGYWIWKPWIILDMLSKIRDGDVLMYSDSGCHFISSMDPIFKKLDASDKGVIVFNLVHKEYVWTKRDCFVIMDCDSDSYWNSNQIMSTFLLCKKSEFSVKLVEDWYKYMSDPRCVWDMKFLPNEMGKNNLDGFIEHRHDQSVLSLLCKKNGITPLEDITEWGRPELRDYPQIVQHTRKND